MQNLFKIVVKGFFISLIIAAVLIGIEIVDGRRLVFDRALMTELAYYCLYGVSLTMINALYFDYIYGAAWKSVKRKFWIGAVGSIVLTMIGIFLIRLFTNVVVEGQSLVAFWRGELLRNYVVAFMITMIMSLFFHAVHFYKRSQEQKVKQQQIIAGTASAQFESLKNQIDPHFLFNSLNVLSSLIEENPDLAQKFTASLSKVYRYVLEQKDKELVNITEELAFAKTYMNLLQMRFEQSLFYELPAEVDNPDGKVVPLSLQLLLENTIKHNVVSEQKPLRIKIYFDGDYLVVENNLQKKEVLGDRQGVGLQNIVSRYGLVTRRNVMIAQDETRFAVSIPVLTKQISIEMERNYNETESAYLKAQKKVDDIKGFYGNLMSYVIVITGLAILNLVTYPKYLWFLWPALGWGIGVIFHGMAVFNAVPFLGKDWEERKIREIMDKEKTQKWN